MTFRFAYGRFFQMPLFQELYQYTKAQSSLQIKGNILGNPALKPPRSTVIEFGTVTEITKDISLDVAIYYKNIKDLITIDYIPAIPLDYYQYNNIDMAYSKGVEICLRKHLGRHLLGSLRYTLAESKGTGSDPGQLLANYLAQVSGESLRVMERTEIPLDFDQRNKLVMEISIFNRENDNCSWKRKLVYDYNLNLFFHYGSGLPYTPVVLSKLNQETPQINSARYPSSKQVDLRLTKPIWRSVVTGSLFLEVINLFDWDNRLGDYSREIGPYDAYSKDWQPKPPSVDYLSDSPYYDAQGDTDHNGIFSVSEQWNRWRYFLELHQNNPLETGQPRLLRAGLSLVW